LTRLVKSLAFSDLFMYDLAAVCFLKKVAGSTSDTPLI